MTDRDPHSIRVSRRRLLRSGLVAGSLPLAAGLATGQARINRQMIIPAVEEFEGAYQGQFVFIYETTDTEVEEVPLDECAFDSVWPREETQPYEAQLLDRRQEVPLAVDLTAYLDGRKERIEPRTHFIIQRTNSCPGDWIGLEAGSVPRRALAGKDPGPTVTPTDGPGFGAIGALVGAAGVATLRALRSDD